MIVGYSLSRALGRNGAVGTLKMALEHILGEDRIELIHHSDRSVQYCSHEYARLLTQNNIRINITENGNPYQNAYCRTTK